MQARSVILPRGGGRRYLTSHGAVRPRCASKGVFPLVLPGSYAIFSWFLVSIAGEDAFGKPRTLAGRYDDTPFEWVFDESIRHTDYSIPTL